MGNFLTAAFNLRLKDIQLGIKEKIPVIMDENLSLKQNRLKVLNYLLPLVGKAYREGIEYSKVVVKSYLDKDIKKNNVIGSKEKDYILKIFFISVETSEAIFNAEMAGYNKTKTAQTGKVKRNDPQKQQIWNAFVNKVISASTELILNAGNVPVNEIYKNV